MKVIVFGGSGYLGGNIAKLINADEVAYFSRHKSEELDKEGKKWFEGTILDEDKVAAAVKDYDMVINAAGIWDEKEQKHFDVIVNGTKNIVNALKENDTDQRLVFISAINVHYGNFEYFRTRRLAEDNVDLLKSHLNVRASFVYGRGDPLTQSLIKLADEKVKLPFGKSLAPTYVDDFVKVIENSGNTNGAIYLNSHDKISFADMANMVRQKLGRKPFPVKTRPGGISKAVESIENTGVFSAEMVKMMLLDYFRETTQLNRWVKEPMTYSKYLDEVVKA